MANFDKAISKVLKNEGDYVVDPDDSGNETKYGISKRAYPELDIKNLTLQKAKEIYKRDYWDRIKADDIASNSVAYEIFDFAVNSGVITAVKLAQMVLDIKTDGIVGKVTLSHLNSIDEEKFIANYKLAKISRYVYLAQRYPKNRKFLLGWIKRALG